MTKGSEFIGFTRHLSLEPILWRQSIVPDQACLVWNTEQALPLLRAQKLPTHPPWFRDQEKRAVLLSSARDELAAEQLASKMAPELELTSCIDAVVDVLARYDPLAAIEARLGVKLFHRSTRRLSLTEAGRSYLEACERILADIEEAEALATRDRFEPRGTLRLNVPLSFG